MGKIYTSYFGNLHKLKDKGIVPVSIALFPPKWYAGKELRELTPDGTLFIAFKEGLIAEDRFLRMYEYKVRQLGKEKIMEMISEVSEGRDVALLCFEHPDCACHRHSLAKFLDIEEFE